MSGVIISANICGLLLLQKLEKIELLSSQFSYK